MAPRPPHAALLRTDHFEIETEAGTIIVTLRRDRRARNYTLRMSARGGGPVLTMPTYGSLGAARGFLESHKGWLQSQLAKTPCPLPIADGATIPFRGTPHLIRHRPGKRGTVSVTTDGDRNVLEVAGGEDYLRRRVIDFLKREARRDLEPAVMRHAEALGVRPRVIRLRDTFSRWGSCTATGELSFSFRLVMAPPFVLDYLAAHEVAHLREMNHSRRFWRLVESICPDADRARNWLVAEGARLHAIGAEVPRSRA